MSQRSHRTSIGPKMMLPVALAIAASMPSAASAGSKVHVGASVPAGQRVTFDAIDHREWDRLLSEYVDDQGMVAYARWKRSDADTRALDEYLRHLSAANPQAGASREAKLAFWINAYNAVTIRGILREYPTSSIRNHTAKVFGYNIWDDLLLSVGGDDYSLNQIEHEILRKLGEPRIHFAIVCASISCPRLLNEAYTREELATQLTENTRHFFAQPGNFRYDTGSRRFHLSSILKWFAEDFGADRSGQLATIAPYLPTEQARTAAERGGGSVSYLSYDWGLNEQG